MISKVFFATDHAGYELKNVLMSYVEISLGYSVEDVGAFEFTPDDDYPDFIAPCVQKVLETKDSIGIILGASGQGEAMVANRVKGIRAAVYYGGALTLPQLAREHNDANVLSLGARFVSEDEAKDAIAVFLNTPFSGEERHIRRIEKY